MEYRNTKQRRELLDYLCSVKTHPTAMELYHHQKEIFPNISLSTVYRNLQILTDQGQIRRVDTGEEYSRFDGNLAPHNHLICEKCGKVIDIDEDTTLTLTNNHNFKLSRVQVNYYGLCEKCQRSEE